MTLRSKSSVSSFTVALLAGSLATIGCGVASPDASESFASQIQPLSAKCPPAAPTNLAAPAGNKLAFELDAIGVQIYECLANAAGGYSWVFRFPEADLLDPGGEVVGTHYVGPTWEADDGSKVVAARVDGATGDPTAIPLLLLRAVSHEGEGRMSKVTYIQRLDTVGGLAPAAASCDASQAGKIARIDYTATYYFYEASSGQSQGPGSCN